MLFCELDWIDVCFCVQHNNKMHFELETRLFLGFRLKILMNFLFFWWRFDNFKSFMICVSIWFQLYMHGHVIRWHLTQPGPAVVLKMFVYLRHNRWNTHIILFRAILDHYISKWLNNDTVAVRCNPTSKSSFVLEVLRHLDSLFVQSSALRLRQS